MSKNCSCNYYLFRIWGVVYFVYERPRLGLGCTLCLVLCKNVGNSNLLNLELITSFSSFLHHHHRNTAGPDVALGIGWLYFHPQNSYFFAVSTFFSKNGLKKKKTAGRVSQWTLNSAKRCRWKSSVESCSIGRKVLLWLVLAVPQRGLLLHILLNCRGLQNSVVELMRSLCLPPPLRRSLFLVKPSPRRLVRPQMTPVTYILSPRCPSSLGHEPAMTWGRWTICRY